MTAHRVRSDRSLFLIAGGRDATRGARAFGEWIRAEAEAPAPVG